MAMMMVMVMVAVMLVAARMEVVMKFTCTSVTLCAISALY